MDGRLFDRNLESLDEKELLQIIIGNKESAEKMLKQFGSLHGLAVRERQEFYGTKGIGKRKALQLAAVFELSRRLQAAPPVNRLKISDPETVFECFAPRMRHLQKEILWVLALNSGNYLLRIIKITEGVLNNCLAHPREIFKQAILESAASIILIHNHPSGQAQPSPDDTKITTRMVDAGKLMGIPVLDHIILGHYKYYSFRENGLIED